MSTKKKIIRTVIFVVLLASILTLGYFILVWTGLWEKINSVEKIKEFILSCGFYGRLIYVILQFLQVTIVPIPSTITMIAGTLVYGPFQASLLSLAGILAGSFFAFFLGKAFGKKFLTFMVGKETCAKWEKGLGRAKYSFLIMMLLPLFPDDVLCLVAGITDMSWEFFAFCQFVSRPVTIFLTCYLGSGEIIPYHGWGLVAWAVIAVVVVALMILTIKYKDKIEHFVFKFRKKKKS